MSHKRAHNVRWVSATLTGQTDSDIRTRFDACSTWFEAAIDALSPLGGQMWHGADFRGMYDGRNFKNGRLEAPVSSYFWRNYLTPVLIWG